LATIPEDFSFGNRILTVPWVTSVSGRTFEARSLYVERYWLPMLGPSTTLLLRYLAARLEESPDGFLLDVSESARSLGLSERSGRHSPFFRTIARAIDFSLIRFGPLGQMEAKRHLPSITDRQVARLPISLQRTHETFGLRAECH
jgi:hypothetical protein